MSIANANWQGSTSIKLDGAFTSDLYVGIHTMTLTVDNSIFPTQVTQAVYTFDVDLKACVVT